MLVRPPTVIYSLARTGFSPPSLRSSAWPPHPLLRHARGPSPSCSPSAHTRATPYPTPSHSPSPPSTAPPAPASPGPTGPGNPSQAASTAAPTARNSVVEGKSEGVGLDLGGRR